LAAAGVAPELDELLDGEDAGQILNGPAILCMTPLQVFIGQGILGEPADVSYTDDNAIEMSLENTCTACGGEGVSSTTEYDLCSMTNSTFQLFQLIIIKFLW